MLAERKPLGKGKESHTLTSNSLAKLVHGIDGAVLTDTVGKCSGDTPFKAIFEGFDDGRGCFLAVGLEEVKDIHFCTLCTR